MSQENVKLLAALWRKLLEGMSKIMRTVHLAMRYDSFKEDEIRTRLLKLRRRSYENELTIQAARSGCPGQRGRLTNGPILSEMNEKSRAEAAGIVDTYNRDLGFAIIRIRKEAPRANRFVYAKRMRDWEAKRSVWKNKQIELFADVDARAMAQSDFHDQNGQFGTAVLRPRRAVCPICIGWVKRGKVPLKEATNNPPPYHPQCPHVWRTSPDQRTPEECELIWVGS